ncbi:MAG: hypothetical protein KGH65_01555 [Candidatus Micrarchaeota archaeon]|nr:hypothetical protein [Candidatus Micrarchaeota archaeon]
MKMAQSIVAVALLVVFAMSLANAQSAGGPCATNQLDIQNLAPWYCSSVNQAVYNAWQQWLPVGFAVMTVAFSIAAILFAIGVALRNQRLRDFGVGEIYEATATALIVILFMFIAAVMIGVLPSLFTGPQNPYVTSLTYITGTITQTTTLITGLFNIYSVDAYYSSYTLGVSLGPQGAVPDTGQFGTFAASGITKFVTSYIVQAFKGAIDLFFLLPAQIVAYLLMEGLLVLNVEYYILIFAMYAAIPVFLLPGVILRAFIPTRSLGGMFMAIAIGFFFIMPLLFAVAFYFTQGGVATSLAQATQQLSQFGSGTGAEQNAISASSPLVGTLHDIQSSMGAYWLSILFYPALIMAITYFAVITISDFIGGFAHSSGTFIGKL